MFLNTYDFEQLRLVSNFSHAHQKPRSQCAILCSFRHVYRQLSKIPDGMTNAFKSDGTVISTRRVLSRSLICFYDTQDIQEEKVYRDLSTKDPITEKVEGNWKKIL